MYRIFAPVLVGALLIAGCGFDPLAGSAGNVESAQGLDLPPDANAIVSMSSTAGTGSLTAKALLSGALMSERVQLDSAVIVLKDIKLYRAGDGEDEEGQSEDAEGESEDELVEQDLESGDEEGDEQEDEEGEGEGEGRRNLELEGPFLVDLINNTVINLGSSNIDDDADDDGQKDHEDADDDNDGVPDDEDEDDDNDGLADEDDHVMGEGRVFDALELPAGEYNRIRFRMHWLHAKDAPEPDHEMIGYSMRIRGTIDDVPFEYCSSFYEEFEVRSAEGIVVGDGSLTSFLLVFDPLSWFEAVDPYAGELSESELSDKGELLICDGSNAQLARTLRQSIHQMLKLARDANGNGHDDAEEDEDEEEGEDGEEEEEEDADDESGEDDDDL